MGRPGTALAARRHALERAADGLCDLAVVGGGITGAGIAREAALLGLSVVLLEQRDFASGTSSRSSKLIHGGVRYLEQGDIGLVREAARERAILRGIAPHLARPTRMMVPTRSRRGRLKLSAGLWTFERLAGPNSNDRYRSYGREATLDREPLLRSDRLDGCVCFTEYATNDARLTLETVLDAAEHGALIANYAGVRALRLGGGGVELSVHDAAGGGEFCVRARVLVNASGPWFDHVLGLLQPVDRPSLQLTRGIHLVFDRRRLPVRNTVVLAAPDGRSTFVVPSDGLCYVGTTDTPYQGDPSEPGVSVEDAEYLLASLAATFADAPLASDVIGTWAGVRPLLAAEGKRPSEISRRDEIRLGPGPVVSIAGGKLTTYRKMAERVLDQALTILGQPRHRPSRSGRLPLVGGDLQEQRRARREAPRLTDGKLEDRLWQAYGKRAASLVAAIARDPHAAENVGGLDGLTRAELDFFVEREMALTVDDVLRRRSSLAMFRTSKALRVARAVEKALATAGVTSVRCGPTVDEWKRQRSDELETVRGAASTGVSGQRSWPR